MNSLDFKKSSEGLIPAIIQDYKTFQVLMLGYMNEEAYEKTKSEKVVTFYSRSKERLWTKGETSGNTLQVEKIFQDCDNDTILVLAKPAGPVCHNGTISCFAEDELLDARFLGELEKIIELRSTQDDAQSSYTAKLLSQGTKAIAQKVGEEAVEVGLAAVGNDDEEFINECGDLLYHLLVLLKSKGRDLSDVGKLLSSRH